MKTAGSERIRPDVSADDVTVDELMAALDSSSDQICVNSSGYVENMFDAERDAPSEELIAPEVLFPDEAAE